MTVSKIPLPEVPGTLFKQLLDSTLGDDGTMAQALLNHHADPKAFAIVNADEYGVVRAWSLVTPAHGWSPSTIKGMASFYVNDAWLKKGLGKQLLGIVRKHFGRSPWAYWGDTPDRRKFFGKYAGPYARNYYHLVGDKV